MAGALINSGTLEEYKPLGEEGHPVYSVAPQLREIIRIRVSPAAANCLSIPKINEDHSVIDWYAAEAGNVVPWSAATETERAFALENLEKIRTDVNSALASINGVSAQEKKNIEKLRDKIFIHPDNTCVSLVNGKAVLSFWGFYTNDASPEDPFLKLRPVVATPAAATEIPEATAANSAFTNNQGNHVPLVEKTGGRPWWLWLLLAILALLLLFFLLRGCAPTVGLPSVGVPSSDSAVTTTTAPAPDAVVPRQSDSVTVERFANENVDIQLGTQSSSGTVDLTITEPPNVDLALPDANTKSITNDSAGALVDKSVLDTENTGTLMPDGRVVTEESLNTALANTEPGNGATAETQTLPPNTETQPGNEPAPENPSVQAPPPEPQISNPPGVTPSGSANAPASTAAPGSGGLMQIPSGAAQSDSVAFMDGRWRASGGLQDAQTGQPVRLFYDFKDGKGSVTVEKGNGVRCRTAAGSSMNNGELLISNQGNTAQCSDGSTLALPNITCKPGAGGQAACTGSAEDGTPLPIIIRQQP